MTNNTYHLTLDPIDLDRAELKTKALLEQAKRQYRVIPNMFSVMANAPALLDLVLHGYDVFRTQTSFTRAEQEVVYLAISLENVCDYCMAAHSFFADLSKVPPHITDALRAGHELPDARLQALVTFSRVVVRTRGHPSTEEARTFLAAGFTERHLLEVILAVGIKTLTTYTNHVARTPLDPIFKVREWKAFRLVNQVRRSLAP